MDDLGYIKVLFRVIFKVIEVVREINIINRV